MTYNTENAQRSGYRETELGWLPEEWEVAELNDVAESFLGGGTPSTSKPEFWGGEIHWTTSKRIDGLYLNQGEKLITKLGLEKSSTHLIPKENLIIGTRVGVGKVAINTVNMAISQDLTGTFIDTNKYSLEFLAYQIRANECQKVFKDCTRGTTIKGIPREDLKKIPLKLPPLPEQRKIAAVLSAIQETRDRTEQVITALQSFKKSLMKHLFTYGPVRADEVDQVTLQETEIGMMPEGWEIAPLKEVCEKIQDGTHFSPKAKKDGEVMYITSKNIRPFRLDLASVEFIDEVDHRKIYRRCDVKKGDLLFTKDGVNTGNCVVNPLEEEFSLLSSVCLIRPIPNLLNHFLCQYINSPEGRSLIRSSMAGSAITRLTVKKIVNITVPVPPLPVQYQIAAILSAVDEKIEKEENAKNALNSFFLSMLHELMTAKIRVHDLDITT